MKRKIFIFGDDIVICFSNGCEAEDKNNQWFKDGQDSTVVITLCSVIYFLEICLKAEKFRKCPVGG